MRQLACVILLMAGCGRSAPAPSAAHSAVARVRVHNGHPIKEKPAARNPKQTRIEAMSLIRPVREFMREHKVLWLHENSLDVDREGYVWVALKESSRLEQTWAFSIKAEIRGSEVWLTLFDREVLRRRQQDIGIPPGSPDYLPVTKCVFKGK